MRVVNLSLIIFIFLVLAFPAVHISAKYSLMYVEGWNAYFGALAADGKDLYSNILASPDYPPLSFYIMGFLGKIFGSIVFTGRVVSVFSLLFVAGGVAYILKHFSKNPLIPILGSLWTLDLFLIFAPDYIGMNSPQFFAHAVMMVGMICYFKFRTTHSRQFSLLAVVAACCLISLFIKHNLVAFPLAVCLDLLLFSKRKFALWCLMFFGIGGLIFYILDQSSGGRLALSVLKAPPYDVARLLKNIRFSAGVLFIPTVLGLLASIKIIRLSAWRWIGFYFFISLGLGVFTYGGFGIDVNLFFDFVIALGIILAISVSDFLPESSRNNIQKGLIVFFVLGAILRLLSVTPPSVVRKKEEAFKKDMAYLSSIEGPAICEDLLLCFWAKKPLLYEPFLVTHALRSHRLDEEAVLQPIRDKKWSVIQINNPEVPNRFTESFLKLLEEYYLREPLDDGALRVFYRPKEKS